MNNFREYLQAGSLDEALELLSGKENSALVAGGTDLLLELRQGRHPFVERLVDVSQIAGIRSIVKEGDWIKIGAGVTHKQIISSELLREHAHCVVEGCGLIGGPQVRNVATIGGNVAHALPAGDGTVSLLALDTQVELVTDQGSSWQPLIGIFDGPGKVNFNRGKTILAGFRFAAKADGEGSAFQRVMRPQGVAIAILNMAGWVKLVNGKISQARIACGPAGPKPFRAFQTENYLAGKEWNNDSFEEAVEIIAGEVSLRTSAHRATKEYRHYLLPVLLRMVLDQAVERAGSKKVE
ncbi:MAG: FAD binding domain-containing protein [Anaerolineales bacterium]